MNKEQTPKDPDYKLEKDPHYCPASKGRCPFADKSGDGEYWCETEVRTSDFERCPTPKKRDDAIDEVFKKMMGKSK